MNPPSDPFGQHVPPPPPQQPASATQPVAHPPLPPDAGAGVLLDSLLKRPAQLVRAACEAQNSRIWFFFLLIGTLAFACYGLVVGSFCGHGQYMVSPLKISIGQLLSLLICFPSFYIFASLSGVEISLRGLAGVFFAVFTLSGLLLLGFAPVAWIFSQSTESVNFIGAMYLLLWLISILFGLRLLRYVSGSQRKTEQVHLNVWAAIFLLVSLQMTTALRPIITPSDQLLPTEKKFFIAYWLKNLSDSIPSN